MCRRLIFSAQSGHTTGTRSLPNSPKHTGQPSILPPTSFHSYRPQGWVLDAATATGTMGTIGVRTEDSAPSLAPRMGC